MKLKGVITGATGYIGSNLLRYLLEQNWELYIIAQPEFGYSNIEDVKDQIHIVEYDKDINTLIDFFKLAKPDVVFHLAAAVINDYKPEQISVLIESNILFGTQVLEAMKHSETRMFINTGTYWQNYNSEGYNPVDLYAATKEAFDKIIQYYVDAYRFRCISLRLFDIYGENDNRPKLLNLLYNVAKGGGSINISPGGQLLDMIHISDVCRAYLKAYDLLVEKTDVAFNIYSVSSGKLRTLKDIILLFEKEIDLQLNINLGARPYKNREVMRPFQVYDTLPNWSPLIDIETGFSKFKTCFDRDK